MLSLQSSAPARANRLVRLSWHADAALTTLDSDRGSESEQLASPSLSQMHVPSWAATNGIDIVANPRSLDPLQWRGHMGRRTDAAAVAAGSAQQQQEQQYSAALAQRVQPASGADVVSPAAPAGAGPRAAPAPRAPGTGRDSPDPHSRSGWLASMFNK